MSVPIVPIRRSIRFSLSLVIAGAIMLAVMAASAVSGWRDLQRGAQARAEMLEIASSGFSAAIAAPLSSGDTRGVYEALRGVRALSSVIHVSVVDADGATTAQLGGGAVLRNRTGNLRDLSGLQILGADNAVVTNEILKGGEQIGSLVILADISDLRAELAASLGWTALAALLAVLFGVAAAQAMVARLTRPIVELASVMADVGARQDFSRRMPASARKDETAVLGDAFNGMIDNIRERDLALARHLETLEQTVEERTHDLRIAKDDAEFANAAKSDFLATMSHEIRTPMNGMMVMAEMLASADLSPKHRRYAEIISRSGAGLLTIINDILDLSKIEAGKLDLECLPFSPDALVEDIACLFWERARSKGLELAIRISPQTPASVVGDPTRFNQVVTNLVNNALKFTEAGGLTIDVSMAGHGEAARLRVAVTDTGVGIAADRIGSIFEAFSQADQSTTRRFGGTGLGLTVCKRLVDAMGGEIVVTSEIGVGSTFAVIVPMPADASAPALPALSGMQVALVRRSKIADAAIHAALADAGCAVRLVDAPSAAMGDEMVLAASDQLFACPVSPGVRAVCLSDIGDAHADGLLRSGAAQDVLSLPVSRRGLWDLLDRAARGELRGVAALSANGSSVARESFAGIAVLAADDNPVNREVLREALLTLDVEADFVENGVEAVEAAAKRRYDVIFMDGSMPEMDGLEATRRIRNAESAAPGLARSLIVALTAQVRGSDADAWKAAGADRHVAKPFTSARLVEALKAAANARGANASVAAPATVEAPSATPTPVDDQATRPDAIIDEAAVATMEAVGARNGRDVLGKIWKLFLGQEPVVRARLALACREAADPAKIASEAHALKSMSLSAGAASVSAICEAIEQHAKAGDVRSALAEHELLAPALELACAAMTARLAERESGRKLTGAG